MNIIYDLLIKIILSIVRIHSLINKKSKKWIISRNQKEYIKYNFKSIWIHCSSLGEFEQAVPIINLINNNIKIPIIISFFSPSGYENVKNQNKYNIFYLPIDTKKNIQELLKYINPILLILIKSEFWYNLIDILKKNNIPIISVSSIFRKKMIYFWNKKNWFNKKLRKIDYFFVQDELSKKLLKNIKIHNVSIINDCRLERVKEIYSHNINISCVEEFKNNKMLIILGSSWEKDENIFIRYINNCKDNTKFIIAPHEINYERINKIIKKIKYKTCIFSLYKLNKKFYESKVLIIDTIGILKYLYKYSNIVYIGGGFNKGIHNILEPLIFQNTVIFGPKYKKSIEAIDMINLKCAFCIKNFNQFNDTVNYIINSNLLNDNKDIIKKYLNKKENNSKIILNYIYNFIFNKFKININMKKISLFIIMYISLLSLNAQQIESGIKGGLHLSNLSGDLKTTSKSGLHLGGYVNYKINDNFKLQPEFMYTSKGANVITYDNSYKEFEIHEISIPIYLKYKVYEKTTINIGPELNWILNAKYNTKQTKLTSHKKISDEFKKNYIGLAIGATYNVYDNISINAFIKQGLNNINNDTKKKSRRSNTLGISLEYKIHSLL